MGHVILFKTHRKGSRWESLVHVLESPVDFPKSRWFPHVTCPFALWGSQFASPLPGWAFLSVQGPGPGLSVFQLPTSLNERHGLFQRCPNHESIAGCTHTCADGMPRQHSPREKPPSVHQGHFGVCPRHLHTLPCRSPYRAYIHGVSLGPRQHVYSAFSSPWVMLLPQYSSATFDLVGFSVVNLHLNHINEV